MKKILKNLDKPLLVISLILFIIGLIMIFSASNITAFMKYSASPQYYFLKQGIILIASFILCLFIIPFHSKSYHLFSTLGIYAIGAVLTLLLISCSALPTPALWVLPSVKTARWAQRLYARTRRTRRLA